MNITIETPTQLTDRDREEAASIAALGFSRANDLDNHNDTIEHLEGGDHLQLVRSNQEMVGFAVYRRLLWR